MNQIYNPIGFSQKEKIVFLYSLTLCGFWGLAIIPKYDIFVLLSSLPLFISFIKNNNKQLVFKKYIILLGIALFLNIIATYINRGQDFYWSFRTGNLINFYPILLYFYLANNKIKLDSLERIIGSLYILFCICYIIQYLILPHEIFKLSNFTESEKRFRMHGQAIATLGYFYFLNKYMIGKKSIYLIYCFLGICVFIMLGFRSLLLSLLICSVFMFYRTSKITLKSLLSFICLLGAAIFLLYQFDFTKNTIESIINRNQEQTFQNEDYIRVQQFQYFTQEHFKNFSDFFFGSGFPSEQSSYGKYMLNLQQYNQYGEYVASVGAWFDWGLIGLSWVAGIPTVTILMTIAIKAILKKVDKQYYYFSFFYLFLILSSITTIEFFRNGAFVFHAMALYGIELCSTKKKVIPIRNNKH